MTYGEKKNVQLQLLTVLHVLFFFIDVNNAFMQSLSYSKIHVELNLIASQETFV